MESTALCSRDSPSTPSGTAMLPETSRMNIRFVLAAAAPNTWCATTSGASSCTLTVSPPLLVARPSEALTPKCKGRTSLPGLG